MGKQRLSSAALLRFQAQLVAQLRSYNAKLRIPDQSSLLARSGDTSSANSVSENFECGDRESDDSVNNQQVETVSKNCLSSAALRRLQAQIVAHLRACNVKLGLRADAEAEKPCRFGALAAATETHDPKNSCSNQFLEFTSSNAGEYHDHVSKDHCSGGDRAACCSNKRRNNSLYSADIRAVHEQATVDFSRLKKRFRPFPPGEEQDERRGSEMAYTASDGYSYVLDGRMSGQTNHAVLQDRPTKT